jgi:hypothetical protein
MFGNEGRLIIVSASFGPVRMLQRKRKPLRSCKRAEFEEAVMLMPEVVCFLCGLLIGRRFEVGAVAGASLIALAVTVFYAISQGFSVWLVLLSIILNLTALQMGYLGACGFIRRAKGAGTRVAAPGPVSARNFTGGESALFVGRQLENGAP